MEREIERERERRGGPKVHQKMLSVSTKPGFGPQGMPHSLQRRLFESHTT